MVTGSAWPHSQAHSSSGVRLMSVITAWWYLQVRGWVTRCTWLIWRRLRGGASLWLLGRGFGRRGSLWLLRRGFGRRGSLWLLRRGLGRRGSLWLLRFLLLLFSLETILGEGCLECFSHQFTQFTSLYWYMD